MDRRPVTIPFAHASEAEMARILDFYAVRWDYEPHTFPILWNLDGDVVESFAPDFYLPDLDLYLEMTTLRQKLVRKKNRKLRRLRELYPDLNVKLFYARDFRALMLKYGRLALFDGLSGTLGQVAEPHGERIALELEAAASPEPLLATRADTGRGGRAIQRCVGRPRAVAPRLRTARSMKGRSRHERSRHDARRRRRDPADRGRDRGEGARSSGPGSAPTTPAAKLTLVSVLKGSLPFMADLMRAIEVPVRIDLMEVSSYGGSSTESSGLVRILKDLSASIVDEDVLIVEDIIDTGLTLNYLIRYLRGKAPATLRICTLLDKPARRLVEINVDYTGFTIPDQFVVGYGLDYGEVYRNLRYVGVLRPEVYSGAIAE